MIPTFWNPINAINKPIPAGMAFLRHSGIALAMYSLAPVRDKTIKMRPEIRITTRPAW